jgi:hypothetical protein
LTAIAAQAAQSTARSARRLSPQFVSGKAELIDSDQSVAEAGRQAAAFCPKKRLVPADESPADPWAVHLLDFHTRPEAWLRGLR